MAQTRDLAAEKARKQKIILAVGGVLLAVIMAIQLPKLLSSDSEATPSASAAEDGGDLVADATAVANNLTGSSGAAVVVAKPAGYVAGVALPGGSTRAKVSTGQLASFTLFTTKDPFVQQVSEESAASTSPSEEGVKASSDSSSGDAAAKPPAADASTSGAVPGVAPSTGGTDTGSSGATGSGSGGTSSGAEYAFATMMVNGNPEQLELKKPFPADDPVFVLAGVSKKAVQIGVAGGSFQGGKPVTLKLGKKLTLVNTATGARWVLKLVYTGTEPETLETFSTGGDAATVDAAQ